ncbi:MAG: glycosyltransferase [Parcubacteria group bacterium]
MLIKFGKAFTTIRRDGLLVGGRRILSYGIIFLKNMFNFPSGDVLIVTGGVGDSAHYRAYNQAEELTAHGIKAEVMLQDNPLLPWFAGRFQIFIFQRTIETGGLKRLVAKIKERQKEIIFETDDLVFDTQYMHQTDLYKNKMSAFEKMQYAKGVGEEILKDEYTRTCTTSTTYLADILRGYGKKVFVAKNKISEHELAVVEHILQHVPKKKDAFVRLGYFSGTHSHNQDFATVTSALCSILARFPQVQLYLAGPLDVDSELNVFGDRIITMPLVSRDKYYENMHQVDICLYPLVQNDPFCQSKSEIRFIEAGALEVPLVAVRNQTFSEAITDGVNGFLAGNRLEWIEKIEQLVVDCELRSQMGKAARAKVLADYTIANSHEEEYYAYLRGKIKLCNI